MNVRDCMTTEVHLCAPGDSVRDAANAMRSADAGSIPVGENDRLVGMITDRDIALRVVGDGLDPETPVRDVMSDEILSASTTRPSRTWPARWPTCRSAACRW